MDTWGRLDILVNQAGILRDKTFAKMDLADFRMVLDVNLMGAVHCSNAVWPHMAAQLDQVRDRAGEMVPPNGSAQGGHEVARATAKLI